MNALSTVTMKSMSMIANDIVTMNCMCDVLILMIGEFNSMIGIVEDFISIDDAVATAGGIELAENDIFES